MVLDGLSVIDMLKSIHIEHSKLKSNLSNGKGYE
jgi:hypothetical protein